MRGLMIMTFAAALTASVGAMAGGDPAGTQFSTALSGSNEVPGPGDSDGQGTVTIKVDPAKKEVCFELAVTSIAPATAAHIHDGKTGVAGPVVVTLSPPPTDGDSNGCVSVEMDLITRLLKDPSDFYVNVHNDDFPNGAVRGQLSRAHGNAEHD